jgi:hypothetical protein
MADISPVTGKPFDFDDDEAIAAATTDPLAHLNGQRAATADQLMPARASKADIARAVRQKLTPLLDQVYEAILPAAEVGLSVSFQLARPGSDHGIRIIEEY